MLKPLIENQTIQVDAHKRGTGEHVLWDDSTNDIHVHKRTNYKVDGQVLNLDIRIPLNSDRNIEIRILNTVRKKSKLLAIAERRVISEILKALSDKTVRERFVSELLSILNSYQSDGLSLATGRIVAKRLAKHFGLPDSVERELASFTDNRISSITNVFLQNNQRYFIRLTDASIAIGQVFEGRNILRDRNNRFKF